LNEVGERIAGEIADKGAITFARFMDLALYCPIYGYYEKEEDIIGRRGDYYTNVSVGSLFGELLAFQFAEWLQQIQEVRTETSEPDWAGAAGGRSEVMRIVEAGAHRGDLARDILGWLRKHRPGIFDRLEYWIVEPSERSRSRQQRRLCDYGNIVHWAEAMAGATGGALPGFRGILFSNELLDAMPVHLLGWDAKARVWFEWGVTSHAGRLAWTRMFDGALGPAIHQSSACASMSHFELPIEMGLLDTLPDGFTTEVCPAAEEWWRTAARALACGKLLTFDYGLRAEEFFMPERKAGTVRGYHRHQPGNDVLAHPGDQDITAHVNFTAIQTAGESAGLRTDAFLPQAQFLTSIAARMWGEAGSLGEWTPGHTRQFQTLTHPEHLGRPFRVLVQSRICDYRASGAKDTRTEARD
jgi:SAM-dependent MidA family methyltransferase